MRAWTPCLFTRRVFEAFLLSMYSYVPARLCTLMLGVCYDTLSKYVQAWIDAGVFERLWGVAVQTYDEPIGLDLSTLLVDGCIVTARNGGEATGNSPVDRRRKGCKRSILTDANGVPLGRATSGANTHDVRLLGPTLDQTIIPLPATKLELDRGYRGPIAAAAAREHEHEIHLPDPKKPAGTRRRRYPIENTHQRHNRFFALKYRACRGRAMYEAMLDLASSIIAFRLCSQYLARPRSRPTVRAGPPG